MTNQAHTTFPSKKAAADHQKRMTAAAANSEEEKHIMADRYKTKMCKNYLAKGECPYEVRCMFAHGEKELRSSEDNIRDGLVSEEAIKTFQRQQNQNKRRLAYAAAREAEERAAQQQQLYADADVENENVYYGSQQEAMHVLRFVPHAQAQQHASGCYTHNPYAFTILPADEREFAVYEEVPEEGYWFEEEAMPAVEEDYYFPSSDMMAPLVPSSVTQQPQQQKQRPQHYKLYDSVATGSFSDEAAYGQSDSSDYAAYPQAAQCHAAELPNFSDETPIVLEP